VKARAVTLFRNDYDRCKDEETNGGEREDPDNDLREANPLEMTLKMFTHFRRQKSLPPPPPPSPHETCQSFLSL